MTVGVVYGAFLLGFMWYFKYKGIRVQQVKEALDVFVWFFQKEKFERVIELGTRFGGLTQFLSDHHDSIHTFDISNRFLAPEVKESLGKVHFYEENIFERDTVRDLIQTDGRVLLLCDNGNKKREVRDFSPFLKVDDVIMAHDYFPAPEDQFGKDGKRRWGACEITNKHLSQEYLKPFYSKEFEDVFWACRIRI